jgi:hypothetical protein
LILSSTRLIKEKIETDHKPNPVIIFFHHPCPDGLTGAVALGKSFNSDTLVSYSGLNHANPVTMKDNIDAVTRFHSKFVNIYFVDITPPYDILKSLLDNIHIRKITLLDHHGTAIQEMNANHAEVLPYQQAHPGRLEMIFDINRSGAGIAYDYANQDTLRPLYIELAQTIDLLTASANPDVITRFTFQSSIHSPRLQKMLYTLAAQTENAQIKQYIEFYLLAAAYDNIMASLFSDYKNLPVNELIKAVNPLFAALETDGIEALLAQTNNIEAMFAKQMNMQQAALEHAALVSTPHNDLVDILLINADIQSGRTFDALITEKLKSLAQARSRPVVAMIVNTSEPKECYWAALRACDNHIDLSCFARDFVKCGLAMNAGGHARASAMQLNHAQLTQLIHPAHENKNLPPVQSVQISISRPSLF